MWKGLFCFKTNSLRQLFDKKEKLRSSLQISGLDGQMTALEKKMQRDRALRDILDNQLLNSRSDFLPHLCICINNIYW